MRGTNGRRILGLAVVLAALSSATAGELVEFVDGRYLRVESHEAVGAFIRLDVAASSFLVIPAERVEAIQRGGLVVYRPASGVHASGIASGPAGSMGEPVEADGALRGRGPWNWDRPAPGVILADRTRDRR